MKKLNKVVTVFSKIGEVCCWVSCGFMVAAIILLTIGQGALLKYIGTFDTASIEQAIAGIGTHSISLSAFDCDIEITNAGGTSLIGAYITFFCIVLFSSGLTAMIFRNIYLIFKTTAGETRFSKGTTPFQPDNIRMVREIGIFSIALPIVQLIISIIARIFLNADMVEIECGFNGVFMGLVVLCLSQYFSYGAELEEETEGLV